MLVPERDLGKRSPGIQRLFRAWVLFATILLILAAVFVIPAALGALGAGRGSGQVLASPTVARFLVGHIFFSLVLATTAFVVVLWMLAVFWLEASRFPVLPTWIGFWLAVAGSLLGAIGTFGSWGEPVLTEFVPVVVEPAFLSGFAFFMAGIAVTTGCFIYAVTGAEIARMPLVPYGMLCTAAIMVATGLASIATITRLFGDWFAFQLAWRTPHILFQAIFWGPAHLIQFAVVGAMLVAWLLLMPHPAIEDRGDRLGRIGFVILVVFSALTLIVLYALDPLALPKMSNLNIAISDAQALPVLFFAVGIVIALVGAGQSNPAWVPSHYQAMIPGAVLIAFMGVTTELIPLLGRRLPSQPLAAVQTYLYGGGILAVSAAMLWAALLGGERHGYFVTVPATGPAVLLWIGGIAAGLGILAFAGNTLGGLLGGARLRVSASPEGSTAGPIIPPASPRERRA